MSFLNTYLSIPPLPIFNNEYSLIIMSTPKIIQIPISVLLSELWVNLVYNFIQLIKVKLMSSEIFQKLKLLHNKTNFLQ